MVGVTPEGAAAAAGIEAGDVIVELDGERIHTPDDLTYQVGLHKPGERGAVVVKRNGEVRTLEVRYEALKHGP